MSSGSPIRRFPSLAVSWLGDTLLEIAFALVMLYWVGTAIEICWHIVSGGLASTVAWLLHIGSTPSYVPEAPAGIVLLTAPIRPDRWFWVRFATGETLLIAISWGVIVLRLRKARRGQ